MQVLSEQSFAIAVVGALIYCIARAIKDLRAGSYVWGALGLVSAIFLLLAPIKTHAIKLDLPISNTK